MAALLWPVVVVLTISTSAEAQTPPDSIRRDTVRVPIPDRLRDSLRADSIRRAPATGARRDGDALNVDSAALALERWRRDSVRAARAVDTIKAPLAEYVAPPSYDVVPLLRLDRDAILSSGAMYLADLLDRVPGVTSFRTGWLAGAHAAAYRGDFQRVRIFIDGVEWNSIGPRHGVATDLVELPLWTLEGIDVERTPGEIRVWARSWRVQRTTPYSRVDIFTGDLNTNGFRGVFARRFGNGFALQLGGQQVSTQRARASVFGSPGQAGVTGDGDQQAYTARLGWARGRFSVDAYGTSVSNRRDSVEAADGYFGLVRYQGARQDGYARVAFNDTSTGWWSQVIVGSLRTRLNGIARATTTPDTASESSDTLRARAQSVVAVGWRRGGIDISLADRIRGIEGSYRHAPALRADYQRGIVAVGAYAEGSGADSTDRAEAFARVAPVSWATLTLMQSRRTPDDSTERPTENSTLLEAGLRVARLWMRAGVLRHDETAYPGPRLLGVSPVQLVAQQSSAIVGGVRGPLYRDFGVDMHFMRWNNAVFGRPQMQVRTDFHLASNWLRRFPRGQFSIDARLSHELRDPVAFYYGVGEGGAATVRTTRRTNLLHGALEIRIQQATLFYQYRNLTGTAYEQVPGIAMPPAVQLYGVRWEFWN